MMLSSAKAATIAALLAVALVGPAQAQETIAYSWNSYSAEIPKDPKRVFVMENRTGLEFALLAGYPIVATDMDVDVPTHLDALLPASTARLPSFRGQPSAEVVLSYDPDLLVVGRGWWTYWQEQSLFKGGGFAVLVVDDGAAFEWRDTMLGQLDAIGRGARGEALLAEYEAAVAAARPEIRRILDGRPVALTDIWDGNFSLHVETFDVAVARDLGITLVTGDAPIEDGYQTYSLETLGVFNDAALIMVLGLEDPAAQSPLWQRVPAVAAGNVYPLDLANSWGFALNGIDLVKDILAAVRAFEASE